jgi:hypothetical protein
MTNDKPHKMLSRIHILLLTVAILLHLAGMAQTVSRMIIWDKAEKTYTNPKSKGGAKVNMVSFPQAFANATDGFLPHYTEDIRIPEYGAVSASLSDEVYEPVTSTDIKATNISANITVHAMQGMMRKKPYAAISFVPLRKNPATGHIEKLVRYTLKIEVTKKYEWKQLPAYAANSVLAGGTWYKVGATSTGIYKLDYNYLKNTCGFDLANTGFSTIAVFGNGGGMVPDQNSVARYDDLQENPTYIVDNNNNNRVDQGDYILFYGQGPDSWTFDSVHSVFDFTKNLYSDTNYYFVTADKGTGKRIQATASAPGASQTVSQFDDFAAHEVDQYSLLSSGKLWFGDLMSTLNTTATINFSFPNLITSSPVKYSSSVAGVSAYTSMFNVTLNGTQVFTHTTGGIGASDYPDAFEPASASGTFSSSSGAFSLVYNFVNPDPNGTSFGYIYQVVLNAKRALTFTGGSMFFRSIAAIGPGKITQFNLSGTTATTHIWDVSGITTIQEVSPISPPTSSLSFAAATSSYREFAAVDVAGSFSNPIAVGSVGAQNLHAIGQPNMLIITPDDLLDASYDLAAFHSQHDHLTVKVATLAQIYNEFGSGRRDISAMRDFIRMVYDKAGSDSAKIPRYVLLFGKGSFDPKDRIPDNNNQMPVYEEANSQNILNSYPSDDFFGLLDPTEGGDIGNPGTNDSVQLLDVSVGRLPAASETEAEGIINKIKLYKSSSTLASWRNIITFVSDYPFDKEPDEFEEDADEFAQLVMNDYPTYNVSKIYCDAYQEEATPGGARFPDVNAAILNNINTGTLIMSYTGHGGVSNWSNGRIFNLSDIQTLQNHEKCPVFVTATCEFSWFDNPALKSAGEYLITNAQGGASALISTVRPVYEQPNNDLQNAIYPFFFSPYQGREPTVGEVTMLTKNKVVSLNSGDVPNTREFTLLGDPAMALDYPQYNVVTTKVDNVPVTQPHDTLKALKYVTISGQVQNLAGSVMTSFNGTCFPLIYDKISTLSTIPNDPSYGKFSFLEYTSTLFKGQCSIINGAFSFSFIVPKDINYAVGFGRISYYADNGTIDAAGYQNNIVIGGSSDSVITSKAGPVIKLYMNDQNFVYGGITDANPKLLALLSDPYGINTTGNGFGHDLTCILDANTQNPIVLNNYYQSALNNFRQGTVLYPFTNLALGVHTITVKAWDILNNSSTDNTEFIVASSAKLALQHVFNYPNPFTTNTEFMFEHNRPGEELNVMIQIFSVSGKLVKTIMQDVISVGYRVDNLRWDGLDDYGDKIGRGVYIYKVHVRDAEGNTANQFQKLVVLR